VAVLTTGCAGSHPSEPGGPRRDLAGRPESLPPLPTTASAAPGAGGGTGPSGAAPSSTRTAPGGTASGASAVPGGPSTAAPSGSAPGGPAEGPYHSIGTATDVRGDAGAGTPPYADLVAVTVEDDGTRARVTVRFAGAVPSTLPRDETAGVGVDLYQTAAQTESDYQLFADGEPDGWYAYLQTPKGFVKYPGRFGVGGDRLVFTVPWSALGSPSSGTFTAFADWTRDTSPTNLSGQDHAPALGKASYTR
jgi:hypothetical protein